MNFKETECEELGYIYLAHDRVQWLILTYMIGPMKGVEFLHYCSDYITISRVLLYALIRCSLYRD